MESNSDGEFYNSNDSNEQQDEEEKVEEDE